MASYPTFDLNSPSAIYDDTLAASLNGLDKTSDAYKTALTAARLKQWRNKCINDTYEPGSTFKPVTLATALETGAVNMNTTFYCSGSIRVQGWGKPIYCSKKTGHGSETLKVATGNSCNPAFITMETLSDIIQIGYFKATHGKRFFKMAPVHHHLELSGWSEEKIVSVFSIVTLVFCVLAYFGIQGRL